MSPSFLDFHDVAPDGHATSIPLHLCPHPPSALCGVPQQQVTQLRMNLTIGKRKGCWLANVSCVEPITTTTSDDLEAAKQEEYCHLSI